MRFFGSMYWQSCVDTFVKYNTSLPSSAAVEQLFFMGAVILTAKRASLMSRNFQRLVFLEEELTLFEPARGCTRLI